MACRKEKMLSKLRNNLSKTKTENAELQKLKKQAESGDLQAKFDLAAYYTKTKANNSDPHLAKALQYLNEIVTSSSKEVSLSLRHKANELLGYYHKIGFATAVNLKKAFMYFNLAANANLPDAMIELSGLYINQENVGKISASDEKTNLEKARNLLEKALQFVENTEQRGKGLYCLAVIEHKVGNPYKFAEYIERSANEGYPRALLMFVQLCIEKPSVYSEKLKKCYGYCVQAEKALIAKNESDINLFWLTGSCYWHGYGTEINVKNALKCYQKAEEQGHNEAGVSIAEVYLKDNLNWKADFKKAVSLLEDLVANGKNNIVKESACKTLFDHLIKLLESCQKKEKEQIIEKIIFNLKQAISIKSAWAMWKLAWLNAKGEYIPKDMALAEKLTREAMALNYPQAFGQLGYWYTSGALGKIEPKLAFDCFQKGSALGDAACMLSLGLAYQNGEGTEQNPNKAFECFKMAADRNFADAYCNLGNCYSFGFGHKESQKLAFNAYRQGALLGSNSALVNLGLCYAGGEWVEKDHSKAADCYEKAANNGDEWGYFHLAQRYSLGLGRVKDKAKASQLLENCGSAFANKISFKLVRARIKYEDSPKLYSKEALNEYEHIFQELENLKKTGENRHNPQAESTYRSNVIDCTSVIAHIYLNEQSEAKDLKKGIFFLEKTAAYAKSAQYFLGTYYLKGTHVQQDRKKAIEYFESAAKAGHKAAKAMLRSLNKEKFKKEEDQLKINEGNALLIGTIACLPAKFQELQKATHNIESLMEVIQGKITEAQLSKYRGFISELTAIEEHARTASSHFEKALEYHKLFDSRYDAVYKAVVEIAEKKIPCPEKIANELTGYMDQYRYYYEELKKEQAIVIELVETLKKRLEEKNTKEITETESLQLEENKLNALLEKFKLAQDKQRVLEQKLKSEKEAQEKQAEDRKQQREAWLLKIKNKYAENPFNALQKPKAKRKDVKSLKESEKTENAAASNSMASNSIPKAFSDFFAKEAQELNQCWVGDVGFAKKPKTRTLNDWQIDTLAQTENEKKTLRELLDFFSKIAKEQKLNSEDAWIEREALVNILARLFELLKQYKGQQNMPREIALHLRNVLFKSEFFKMPGSDKTLVLQDILTLNDELKESIGKILEYLNIKLTKLPQNFDELKKHITTPFLDKLIVLKIENPMDTRKWFLKDCRELIETERKNLETLQHYQGIFAKDKILAKVRNSIEARVGSVASYLKRHKAYLMNHLNDEDKAFFQTYEALQAFFKISRDRKLIQRGNDWRHARQPLGFSTNFPASATSVEAELGIASAVSAASTASAASAPSGLHIIQKNSTSI